MINRELIRIKIVQLTYAYYQNGNKNMDAAEKELLFSLSKAYDLYNYLLDLMVAITQEERHRLDVLNQRAEREGTERLVRAACQYALDHHLPSVTLVHKGNIM
ncbi:MAG TPA: hypothetical protein DHV83_04615, partial [Prevotella sp.]|nr:hypothetical protein [Prevotella sp.]